MHLKFARERKGERMIILNLKCLYVVSYHALSHFPHNVKLPRQTDMINITFMNWK